MRFAFLIVVLALAPSASAQMLPSGTWTGTWTAGRRALPATAEIERCATGFRVTLATDGHEATTETAAWSDGRLHFTTDRTRMPGMLVARALTCTLAATDGGGLGGTCVAGRTRYRLALRPPSDGAFGCDE